MARPDVTPDDMTPDDMAPEGTPQQEPNPEVEMAAGPAFDRPPSAIGGIAAIRRALALGAEEEALVHRIGKQLTPHVAGWIDDALRR